MIEADLRTHLMEWGALIPLVNRRIYPQRLPQKATYPSIVYHLIDAPHEYAFDGGIELVKTRFQIDCWASGVNAYMEAKELAEVVKNALSGWRATVGDSVVHGCFIEGSSDQIETLPETGSRNIRGVRMELSLIYAELA